MPRARRWRREPTSSQSSSRRPRPNRRAVNGRGASRVTWPARLASAAEPKAAGRPVRTRTPLSETHMKRLLLGLAMLLATSLALAATNLNTATKEELDALPGIGRVKAQAIIDYRTANGAFKTPEDVMKVKGIKEGEFGKIKDQVAVSGRTVAQTTPSAG